MTGTLPAAVLLSAYALAAHAQGLDHTKWKLVETRNAGIGVPADHAVILTFMGTNLSVRGCNTLRSAFKAGGGKITAGPMASTRMACRGEAARLDHALSQLLQSASYRIVGDQLNLTGAGGDEWSFVKQLTPPKDARTKFIYVASETKECAASAAMMKCLQIRDSRAAPWRLNYTPIIGFEHTPGIEYRLRIKEEVRAHPPADASKYVWYLDTIIQQRWVKP